MNDRDKFDNVETRIAVTRSVHNNTECVDITYYGRLGNAVLYLTREEASVLLVKLTDDFELMRLNKLAYRDDGWGTVQ